MLPRRRTFRTWQQPGAASTRALHVPLSSSHPKTSLIVTTILDADGRVDHKTAPAFPSYVGTQSVRESNLWGAGNIPVDAGFVPSRAQQNHSPAHPGVLKTPWFPQKEDFPWRVDSAQGWCIPNPSHLEGGTTRICLAAFQPSVDVASTRGTPVLSLKASAMGLPAKGLVLVYKGREKG